MFYTVRVILAEIKLFVNFKSGYSEDENKLENVTEELPGYALLRLAHLTNNFHRLSANNSTPVIIRVHL